jgi:hypothetical protein
VTIDRMLRGLMNTPLETVLGMTPVELLAAVALAALAVGAVLTVVGWVWQRF